MHPFSPRSSSADSFNTASLLTHQQAGERREHPLPAALVRTGNSSMPDTQRLQAHHGSAPGVPEPVAVNTQLCQRLNLLPASNPLEQVCNDVHEALVHEATRTWAMGWEQQGERLEQLQSAREWCRGVREGASDRERALIDVLSFHTDRLERARKNTCDVLAQIEKFYTYEERYGAEAGQRYLELTEYVRYKAGQNENVDENNRELPRCPPAHVARLWLAVVERLPLLRQAVLAAEPPSWHDIHHYVQFLDIVAQEARTLDEVTDPAIRDFLQSYEAHIERIVDVLQDEAEDGSSLSRCSFHLLQMLGRSASENLP